MRNPLSHDLARALERSGGLWEELRGARVFMTGGTGFFGCWMLETLLRANDRLGLDASVVVLTRNAGSFRAKVPHLGGHPAVTMHPGDIRTFEFPCGAFTHVIHAAVETGAVLDRAGELREFESTVDGTRRALQFAYEAGATRFLLTSSGSVYGRQPPEMMHVPEDYAGGPDTTSLSMAGAEAKRAAEMLCALNTGGPFAPTV